MNKDFNCVSFQKRVDQESENFFDEEFWNKQDYIDAERTGRGTKVRITKEEKTIDFEIVKKV